jgi:hypothetical protein
MKSLAAAERGIMIRGTMTDYGICLEHTLYVPQVACFLFSLESIEHFLGSLNFNHLML